MRSARDDICAPGGAHFFWPVRLRSSRFTVPWPTTDPSAAANAIHRLSTFSKEYCDAADSLRRRATQMVMHEILGALCRLLALVLVIGGHSLLGGSVHLQEFPLSNIEDTKRATKSQSS